MKSFISRFNQDLMKSLCVCPRRLSKNGIITGFNEFLFLHLLKVSWKDRGNKNFLCIQQTKCGERRTGFDTLYNWR